MAIQFHIHILFLVCSEINVEIDIKCKIDTKKNLIDERMLERFG